MTPGGVSPVVITDIAPVCHMSTSSNSAHAFRRVITVLVGYVTIVNAVGCGGGSTETPADTSPDGVWTNRSAGVLLSLTLSWTRDSVKGPGTYVVLDNTLSCGGSNLHGSGSVAFAAARSGSAVTGRMAFDNGWTPPYSGSVEMNVRINGSFQSVDRGTCPFPLYFGLVP